MLFKIYIFRRQQAIAEGTRNSSHLSSCYTWLRPFVRGVNNAATHVRSACKQNTPPLECI